LAAGHEMTLPDSFVLVGHSLGGGFVTAMAGYLDAESRKNLKGVVLFDPVTTSTDAMSTALGQLPGVPVMVIASPPYYWNQLNAAANVVAAARPGEFVGVVLNNGSHSDYVQGSNPLFELGLYAVTGFSQPQNVDAVQVLAGGWITDMLNNTHTGVYGVAGQPISIPTGAGVATGIALPDNVHQPSVVDVLLVAVVNFLTAPLSAA
jgi:pimeloyl-ACP methyl ester carboxylesterase